MYKCQMIYLFNDFVTIFQILKVNICKSNRLFKNSVLSQTKKQIDYNDYFQDPESLCVLNVIFGML